MKRIFKGLSCALICACLLMGAGGCRNSVSDIRRRERILHEQERQERRLAEEREQEESENEPEKAPDIDPEFGVDPERGFSSEIPL